MNCIDLLESVKSKINSDTIFIIGGGLSLLKYLPDRNILLGKNIITTNNGHSLFPNALISHFADRSWWGWNKDIILPSFKGEITTCAHRFSQDYDKKRISIFLNGDKKGGITTDRNKLNGNNTGHQAINIAVHLQFKNIVLIGFDMDPKARQTQWHNEHKRPTNTGNYEGTMIPGINQIVPFQKQLGFNVYNVNKESNIRCFQFADIKDFL